MTHWSAVGGMITFLAYEAALLTTAFFVGRVNPAAAAPFLFMAVPVGGDTATAFAVGAVAFSTIGHGDNPRTVIRSAQGGPGLPSSNYALSSYS